MSRITDAVASGSPIHVVLKESARGLTSRDLVRIIEIAREADAVVHVTCASWQVLVGVPEVNFRKMEKALASIGYACTGRRDGMSPLAMFALEEAYHETKN